MTIQEKYFEKLKHMPAPGEGEECHPSLLGAANYGIMAGITPEEIFSDIRASIPYGKRKVTDREITDAVIKAMRDHSAGSSFTPRQKAPPVVKDSKAALQTIIEKGNISTEVDLWESSPIRLMDEPAYDAALFFKTLYENSDLVFAGARYDTGNPTTIRPVCKWIDRFESGKETPEFFIINPLSGLLAETKDGKPSYRADGCVNSFHYTLAEFDNLSREDQIRFWSSVKLPIRALVDSGNKSIHAIIDVQKLASVQTLSDWSTHIKGRLFDQILTPLGVDSQCSNTARLSRLPGHYRTEKQKWQRLLWLSDAGRPIQC